MLDISCEMSAAAKSHAISMNYETFVPSKTLFS